MNKRKYYIKKNVSLLLIALLTGSIAVSGCKKTENTDNDSTKAVVSEYETNKYKISANSTNTLPNISVHDPSIFKDPVTEKYYVFGSHLAQAKSDNLINWSYLGTQGYTNSSVYGNLSTSLAGSFKWAGYDDSDCKGSYAVWAPDIIYNENYIWEDGSKGAYMLYYSASSTYCRSCIGFAVSKNVESGYQYVDTVIYSGFTSNEAYDENSNHNKYVGNTNVLDVYETEDVSKIRDLYFNKTNYNTSQFPNAIDPSLFFDKDGKLYMTYGSWSGGIWIIEIDSSTGLPIHDEENNDDNNNFTDKYFGRRIAYGKGVSGEGPYIRYNSNNGYYYMFTTLAGLASNGGYNMRMFRSQNPEGSYVDAEGKAATEMRGTDNTSVGIKVMGGYDFPSLNTGYLSPGHNSFLIDGDKYYLVYHTRFEDRGETHQLRVHQMFLNEDGWFCVLPFEYNGEEISKTGYEVSELDGVYYILDHDTDSNTVCKQAIAYIFDKNGNIAKASRMDKSLGTWSVKEGTPYISFKIGIKEYKGIICRMKDEAGNDITAISAVSDDNNSLWGVMYR